MTDFTNTVPIQLNEGELSLLRSDGTTAEAKINAANTLGQPPPVGVWQKMYNDISAMITGSSPLLSAPAGQQFWFSQAGFITSDNEAAPSGYFVRDITAVGFGVASPSDPEVQAVSNAIGAAIFNTINTTGALPAFWQQLSMDIYSALAGGTSPYPYPALPVAGWGGTFYYLNAPYDPNQPVTSIPTTPPTTSIGQYVLNNSSANQTFVTNDAQAVANTAMHFLTSGVQLDQVIPSILGTADGAENLWNFPGWQGKLDLALIAEKSVADFQAEGGVGAALGNALINYLENFEGLFIGSGSANIAAAGGTDVLVGGQGIGSAGNDTLVGGGGADTFLVNLPTSGSVTETINDGLGLGQILVASNGQFDTLGGSAADPLTIVTGQQNTWQDAGGTQYVYTPSDDQLAITGGYLGAGNAVIVDDFDLALAADSNPDSGSAGGDIGIFVPVTLNLTAGATIGTDPPAHFPAGSSQSYTLSVDGPSTGAQTIAVTLSGASASDFEVMVGNVTTALNADGTFNVSLPAGETNVAFTLIDTTAQNGSSDIAGGATLQLASSMANPNSGGAPIEGTSLSVDYIPGTPDTATAPNPTNTITGTYDGSSSITSYYGDGGNDIITAGTGPNYISAANSVNDSITGGSGHNTIYGGSGTDVTTLNGSQDYLQTGNGFNTVYGGTGQDTIYTSNSVASGNIVVGNNGQDVIIAGNSTNQIYGGSDASLSTAITAAAGASGTGQQGDLIAVGSGNDTIVGSNGNDLITAGGSPQIGSGGNDVVVLGGGDDTFVGGYNIEQATGNWTWTSNGNNEFVDTNIYNNAIGYTNPYVQPYNGNEVYYSSGPTVPVGAGNVSIFGSTGSDYIELPNGNNFVQLGSGDSSVFGGMGNESIFAGSGADFIRGGGGSTYIYGGSGSDSIYGGDGSNTIIGGSGNATIYSAEGPDGLLTFANSNLNQNYVDGGSGNDAIYGSSGQDTLIAGSGNTSVYGQTGSTEYLVGGSGNDLLAGGTGNDTIVAEGAGHDTLFANGSSTTTSYVYGGTGEDVINGGSGTNYLYAGDGGTASGATSVFASQSDSTATTTIYGGAGVDYLESGTGSTVIFAGDGDTSAAPTSIIANSGNGTLYGGLGTDFVQGGSGTDVLYAGDGGTASAPTSVISGSGIATLYGGAGTDLLQDTQGGQDVLYAGTGNDSLLGVGNDTLVAGPGNEVLQTDSGSVTVDLNGGFGNDTVLTPGGDVNLSLGTGQAPTDFSGGVGFDSVGSAYLDLSGDGGSVSIKNGLSGAIGGVSFVDSGSISMDTFLTDALGGDLTQSFGSNNYYVNLGSSEAVTAGSYYDSIASFGAGDTLTGGSTGYGDAIYSAGSGAVIASNAGADSINAAGSNDAVTAGALYGDHITVSGGNSIVTSRSENDTITASGTNDTLVGGSGLSTFYVNDATTVVQVSVGGGSDTIFASVSYTAPTNI
jgi:Ca2+-binding RTX toxin-like protein